METLSRKILENDSPELLEQIQAEARAEAKADGIAGERRRAIEILEAGGDPAIALQAVRDGIRAEAFFKLLFKTEKKKGVGVLDEMAAEAPEALGQDESQK